MKLEKNQILLTVSDDKKALTIECGAFHYPVIFDVCPNNIIKCASNAIETYDEIIGLSNIPEWSSDGCGHKDSGSCLDCN